MSHSWIVPAIVGGFSGVLGYIGEDLMGWLKITAPTTTDPDDAVAEEALEANHRLARGFD
jgi:hypothetical protein